MGVACHGPGPCFSIHATLSLGPWGSHVAGRGPGWQDQQGSWAHSYGAVNVFKTETETWEQVLTRCADRSPAVIAAQWVAAP